MDNSGASVWRAILDPGTPPPDSWRFAPPVAPSVLLSDLITPALASFALKPAAEALDIAVVDPEAAHKSKLMNRFIGVSQRRWMKEIARSGVQVMYLKGFVFAHTLYPDPDLRTIGDLDLLVAEHDLEQLLAFLTARGFGFQSAQPP